MSLIVHIRKKMHTGTLDVNFETGEGVLAILGASGSGKSLLLRCIAGLETPDEGSIELNGRILYDSLKKINLPASRRRVGYLFCSYALFPSMSVEESLRITLRAHEKTDDKKKHRRDRKLLLCEKTSSLLKEYHLDGIGGCLPAELSRLQQFWAAYARMMAADPELILLDEPFTGPDPYLRANILREAKDRIAEKKLTAVFASSCRDEVYAMSSTVIALERLVSTPLKEKADFFTSPQTLSAALLSGCRNVADAQLLDSCHALVPAWNCIFSFRDKGNRTQKESDETTNTAENAKPEGEKKASALPLSGSLCAIGIRESDFLTCLPQGADAADYYRFTLHIRRIEETLTDYQVWFCTGKRSEKELLWQVPKSALTREKAQNTRRLFVPCDKIMLLM